LKRFKTLDELLNFYRLRNMLGEAMHDIWVDTTKAIAKEEQLSLERMKRWQEYWVPFEKLSEDVKEMDRKLADKIIEVLKKYLVEVGRW